MAAKNDKETTEEKKVELPILIGLDDMAKNNLIFDVKRLFEECKEIATALKSKGVEVTREILDDCLCMSRSTQSINDEVQEVFDNCEHLDEAFANQIAEAQEDFKTTIARNNAEKSIKEEAYELKSKVLEIRAKYSENEFNTDQTRKYIAFENNEVLLPSDLEERCAKDTGLWITTEKQAAAWEDHKLAAEAIGRFLKHFPKSVWPTTMQEVGNLFQTNKESGEFEPVVLNYASYIN